ncbi:hypothetical protein ACFYNW_23990 [Streptomyces virginiae]|uniref:hypothetical protein n=1 Tax=Streptomyces virginiae TaxID=1961 RepID=UPI0036F003BB
MLTLQDLLQSLDQQPAEGLIHAAKPWTAASAADIAALDAPPRDLAHGGELGHLDFLQVLCQDDITRRAGPSPSNGVWRGRSSSSRSP